MLSENEMSPPPSEKQKVAPKTKPEVHYVPAKEYRIAVYTRKPNPFPNSITYQHLKENITTNKYKITFPVNNNKENRRNETNTR